MLVALSQCQAREKNIAPSSWKNLYSKCSKALAHPLPRDDRPPAKEVANLNVAKENWNFRRNWNQADQALSQCCSPLGQEYQQLTSFFDSQ